MSLTQLNRGLCVLITQEKRPTCKLWVVSHVSAVCMLMLLINTQVASQSPASSHYWWWVKCVIMGVCRKSRKPAPPVSILHKDNLLFSLNWWELSQPAAARSLLSLSDSWKEKKILNFASSSSEGLEQQCVTNSLFKAAHGAKRGISAVTSVQSWRITNLDLLKKRKRGI